MSVRATAPPTLEAYLALVRKSGLLSEETLSRALAGVPANLRTAGDAHALARVLIEKELLTPWQHQFLMRGKHKGFFLGKYKLLRLLGSGGMGSVYLAEHTLMHRRVALKVLTTKKLEDSVLQRFLSEAQAIAALDHPNIIRAFNVDSHERAYYLVMEYVEGQDLEQVVRKSGPLKPEVAARYLRQAAEGLAHAHERGMVHRDIKPSNLLVTANGHVKILDLGLAVLGPAKPDEGDGSGSGDNRGSDDDAAPATVAGTMDYIAPETAMGSTVDARSDLYSLGCTLHFLLIGAPPFPSRTLHELLLKHQTQPPPAIHDLRPDVPRDLVAIAHKLMAKKPGDRYASAAKLREALDAWLQAHDTGAAPTQVLMGDDDETFEDEGSFHFHDSSPTLSSAHEPTVAMEQPARDQPPWGLIAGGVGGALAAIALLAMLLMPARGTRDAVAQAELAKKQNQTRRFVDKNVTWQDPPKVEAAATQQPQPPAQPAIAAPPPEPTYPAPPEYPVTGVGKRGQGLVCRGQTYPSVPHTDLLEPDHLTVACWVWCDALIAEDETRRWIVNKTANETVGGHYGLMVFGDRAGAYLHTEGDNHVQSEPVLKARTWQHLAMTYDGADLKVYVDGAQVAARNIGKPRWKGNGPLVIGRRVDGYVPFHGQIDEVRIYNRALPAAELDQLAKAEAAPLATPIPAELAGGLVAHWPFEELPVWELNRAQGAVSRLFEDDPYFPYSLVDRDSGSLAGLDFADKYRGRASLLVTPVQSHKNIIPGVQMKIREKPALGEYRYLRFAWKKSTGKELCIQIGHDQTWGGPDGKEFRYHAGETRFPPSRKVADQIPTEWTLVTRDLWADFGDFTLSGLAVSPGDGECRIDHIWLARNEGDFDLAEADVAAAATDWSQPPVQVHCGLADGEQRLPEGYGVELVQGDRHTTWSDFAPRKYCFYHPKDLQFRVKVPAGSAGLLRMYLVDGGAEHRKQKVIVEGREVVELGGFALGEWLVVPVTAKQTEDGFIDVSILAGTEKNAVCSEIEFVPRP